MRRNSGYRTNMYCRQTTWRFVIVLLRQTGEIHQNADTEYYQIPYKYSSAFRTLWPNTSISLRRDWYTPWFFLMTTMKAWQKIMYPKNGPDVKLSRNVNTNTKNIVMGTITRRRYIPTAYNSLHSAHSLNRELIAKPAGFMHAPHKNPFLLMFAHMTSFKIATFLVVDRTLCPYHP